MLDGITAAVFSVMVPLVVADLTRGTGHFNLGQGIVGTFVGIGASLSATLAGYITDHFGSPAAFAGLAAIALVGFAVAWFLMPETRPRGGCRLDGDEPRLREATGGRIDGLQSRRVVGDQPQMRRDAVRHAAIDRKIVLRHAPRGEALLEASANLLARQVCQAIDRADRAVDRPRR